MLTLPTDRPRPVRPEGRHAFVAFTLDAPLRQGLEGLSQQQGVTLGTTLLAAWGVVLARLAGQTDVVVATHDSRLDHALAVPLSVAGDPGAPAVAQMLAQARQALVQADQCQGMPFTQWVSELGVEVTSAYAPLAQAAFVWNEDALNGAAPAAAGFDLSPFDLSLEVTDASPQLEGRLQYATALFEHATVARFADCWRRLLAGMVAEPARSVMVFTLLDEAHYQDLVHTRNARQLPFDEGLCIHQLFEAQVARQPDAVAGRFGDQALSYGALNAQANRLAHHLRSLGVGPDTRVGLCLERSLNMLVGVLAVLKAGAAYVPLDPGYPQARLAHLLADSAAPVVLTQGAARGPLRAALAGAKLSPALLDLDDTGTWAGQPATNPDAHTQGLTSRHLAYVIYTSGSTGTPKGVMVEHRGLVALSAAWAALYPLAQPLNHLQMAGFSFDVFSADLIRSLCFGGTLVLCPETALLEPSALYRLLHDHRIGFADFVPAVLNPLLAWLEDTGHNLAFMTTLVCGSDVWTAHSARRLRQRCHERVQIVQAYGVTEASIDSACYEVGTVAGDEGVLPIGQALPNTRLYVLDALGMP
jgi:amino acid adenylation domain-containing protein